ncbi:MAG: hypothetical protein IT361_01655 [Gemmatimonadaceae bacterium]|nr:hypothetical protein [Gemmatimonadaceae bacterium]
MSGIARRARVSGREQAPQALSPSRRTIRALHRLAALAFLAPALAASQGARLPSSALREDLAAFRAIIAGDKAYTADARGQVQRRLAVLEAALDTVSVAWFELELTRLVALADNGHSNAQAASRSTRFNRIALRLTPLGDGFHVLRARGPLADLLGARLVAIDERGVDEVRHIVHTLTGGTDGWRDRFVPYAFESPQQLHALGVAREPGAATYRFALGDGRLVDRRLVADAPDANRPRNGTARWMFPDVALPNEGPGWRSLLAREAAPWALQDIGEPFRWREIPELHAVHIELRQTANAPGRPIAEFLARVESEIRQRKPTHAIVDLRINGGGDLNTTRAFMMRLPSLVPGRIFALTSPYTFSAAISGLGYLEQAAPDRVTIVGELVGDRLMFFAEGGSATLPNTGIVIGRATERHDYATGCRPFPDCHPSVVQHAIAVKSLAPDIVARWTIEVYRAGRDPGLEAIAAILR